MKVSCWRLSNCANKAARRNNDPAPYVSGWVSSSDVPVSRSLSCVIMLICHTLLTRSNIRSWSFLRAGLQISASDRETEPAHSQSEEFNLEEQERREPLESPQTSTNLHKPPTTSNNNLQRHEKLPNLSWSSLITSVFGLRRWNETSDLTEIHYLLSPTHSWRGGGVSVRQRLSEKLP